MNKHSGFLQHLSEAPEDEIEPATAARFKVMADADTDPQPTALRAIIAECAGTQKLSEFAEWAITTYAEQLELAEHHGIEL